MLSHILNPLVQAVNEVTFLFGSCDPIMQALCVLLLLSPLVIWGVLFSQSANNQIINERKQLCR